MQSGNFLTLAALVWNPIAAPTALGLMAENFKGGIATLMTTKSRKKSTGGNQQPQTQTHKPKKPAFVSRYIGIDSHLTERNGAGGLVFGMAAERPAGRKLAEDISRCCVQLDAEGYDVISIFPLTSGRSAKAAVETESNLYGGSGTYTRRCEVQENDHWGNPRTKYVDTRHVDTGIGYSVTDGVVITAKLRK